MSANPVLGEGMLFAFGQRTVKVDEAPLSARKLIGRVTMVHIYSRTCVIKLCPMCAVSVLCTWDETTGRLESNGSREHCWNRWDRCAGHNKIVIY